jgi:hypothetical protein
VVLRACYSHLIWSQNADVFGQSRLCFQFATDNDLILVLGKQKRAITGSDLLGRLLRETSIKEG